MKKRFFSWFFTAALLAFFSVAQASTFVTHDAYYEKLGLAPNYPNSLFDKLTIDGSAGQINASGGYKLADLKFEVGYNAYAPLTNTGFFDVLFDIGTSQALLKLPYTIYINTSDTLKIGSSNVSLNFGGYVYNVVTRAIEFANVGMSSPIRNGELMADVTVSAVPLPPAILLMLPGLGLLGFMSRRNKKKEV